MKLIFLSFLATLALGISAFANDVESEGKIQLNCDHMVAGATCPAKMASTACLTCDTKEPKTATTGSSSSESDK